MTGSSCKNDKAARAAESRLGWRNQANGQNGMIKVRDDGRGFRGIPPPAGLRLAVRYLDESVFIAKNSL
jgi:hypothetical protein